MGEHNGEYGDLYLSAAGRAGHRDYDSYRPALVELFHRGLFDFHRRERTVASAAVTEIQTLTIQARRERWIR